MATNDAISVFIQWLAMQRRQGQLDNAFEVMWAGPSGEYGYFYNADNRNNLGSPPPIVTQTTLDHPVSSGVLRKHPPDGDTTRYDIVWL